MRDPVTVSRADLEEVITDLRVARKLGRDVPSSPYWTAVERIRMAVDHDHAPIPGVVVENDDGSLTRFPCAPASRADDER